MTEGAGGARQRLFACLLLSVVGLGIACSRESGDKDSPPINSSEVQTPATSDLKPAPTTGSIGPQDASAIPGETTPIRIGLFQIVEHTDVNALRNGFWEVVAPASPLDGRPIEFTMENAQNDNTMIEQISDRFVAARPHLIYVMGSSCAVSLAAKTRSIPIVLGAMTDPVAAEIVQAWERPGCNVTGTSDLPDVEKQLHLVSRLLQVKRLGALYNQGEKNSVSTIKKVRETCARLGWQLVERTAANTGEVSPAATSLVGACDLIYVPPDNTIHAALHSVISTAEAARLPVVGCTESVVVSGGLFALAVDYRELGRLSGEMAIEILNGKNPVEMPIRTIEEPRLILNVGTARRLGIEIPEDLMESASRLID